MALSKPAGVIYFEGVSGVGKTTLVFSRIGMGYSMDPATVREGQPKPIISLEQLLGGGAILSLYYENLFNQQLQLSWKARESNSMYYCDRSTFSAIVYDLLRETRARYQIPREASLLDYFNAPENASRSIEFTRRYCDLVEIWARVAQLARDLITGRAAMFIVVPAMEHYPQVQAKMMARASPEARDLALLEQWPTYIEDQALLWMLAGQLMVRWTSNDNSGEIKRVCAPLLDPSMMSSPDHPAIEEFPLLPLDYPLDRWQLTIEGWKRPALCMSNAYLCD